MPPPPRIAPFSAEIQLSLAADLPSDTILFRTVRWQFRWQGMDAVMTTTYRAVQVWFQGEQHWAVEISRPDQKQKPEPHGYYSSEAEAQAEADRLAALPDAAPPP
jgi:hypothetical protein